MSIDDAIYAKADSHAGLEALIGAPPRLYPMVAPQNAVTPYVTYQQISGPRVHAMGTDPGVASPRFQFSAWGATNTEAKTVALQLLACFSRWRGVMASVDVLDSLLENEADLGRDEEAQLHQRIMDFVIWHRE
jgi:uncharacterized protein DUF3168